MSRAVDCSRFKDLGFDRLVCAHVASVRGSQPDWRSGGPCIPDTQATLVFAKRLMQEVSEPFNAEAVPQFYGRDVVGHHRKQRLAYDDVVNRLVSDRTHFGRPVDDIQDIVAAEDKFAIRYSYPAIILSTTQKVAADVIDFYHLKDGRIAEFWLLADMDFDL